MISLDGFSLPGSQTADDAEEKNHDKGQATEGPASDWMSGFVGGLGITAKAEEDSNPVGSKGNDESAEPDLIKEIAENIANALGMGSGDEEETPKEAEENSWVPNLGFQMPDPFASVPDSDKDKNPQAWPAFPNFWDQPEPSKSSPVEDEKANDQSKCSEEESNNTGGEDRQILLQNAETNVSEPSKPDIEQDGFMTVPLVADQTKPTSATTGEPNKQPDEVEPRTKESGTSNEQGKADDTMDSLNSAFENKPETISDEEEKVHSDSVGGGMMNPKAPKETGEEECAEDQAESGNDNQQAIEKHSGAQTDLRKGPKMYEGACTKHNDESSNDEEKTDPRRELKKQPSFLATSIRSLMGQTENKASTPNFFDNLFGATVAETGKGKVDQSRQTEGRTEAPNLFGSIFGGTPPETGKVPEDVSDVNEISNETVVHSSNETKPTNTDAKQGSEGSDARDEDGSASGSDWLYSLQSFVSLQMAGVVDLVVTKPRHPKFHNRKAKAASSGGTWSFAGLSF